jgi:hypothetical protein
MKQYMKSHIENLQERLDAAIEKKEWKKCIEIEARIQEAELLYVEMLSRNIL